MRSAQAGAEKLCRYVTVPTLPVLVFHHRTGNIGTHTPAHAHAETMTDLKKCILYIYTVAKVCVHVKHHVYLQSQKQT